VHEQKISKLKDQMLSVKTNEQYRAFQHEIEFIQKEVRKAEDRILELMAESELLEGNVKTADAALKEEKKQVDAEKVLARERTAADRGQLEELRMQREQAAAKLPPPALHTYDRVRKKWNGSVVGEAVGGRCSACQIVIRPQYMQELKRGDQMMLCESCGRFLYYNPPVNVEDGTRVAM
jgi:predicted  nucleic acid-binding Zn-ribbon protein